MKQALADGCDHVIIVLTRDRSYIKKPESFRLIYSNVLKKYPNLIKALDNRHVTYNDTLKFIKELEQQQKATVIAPTSPLEIGRFEKNINKLKNIYELGYLDASKVMDSFKH